MVMIRLRSISAGRKTSRKTNGTRNRRPKGGLFGKIDPKELPVEGVLLAVELPIKLTNRNDGQGRSWHASHRFRKACEAFLIAWQLKRTPFEFPVKVRVTRLLAKYERRFDEGSKLRGNWKQIEDSLVAVGWFHDDSPKWIKDVECIQDDRNRGEESRIRIEVIDAAGQAPVATQKRKKK